MPNILITPSSGILEFSSGVAGGTSLSSNFGSGAGAVRLAYDGLGGINLTSYANFTGINGISGLDRFAVDGSQGRLFSVTDVLSGSLMSVNDIAGLPILEVFDTNTVVIGQFNRNDFILSGNSIGIGTVPQTGIYKLLVSGDTNIAGALYVSGNRVLTGVDLSSYATITNLASTGSTLATNLVSTGSTLSSTISNISGKTVDLLNSGQLLFTIVNSTTRRLDNYLESGIKYIVRNAQFNASNKLELTLASFNPNLTISNATPGFTLNWDQPLQDFTISVANPSDYTTQYITGVYYFTGVGVTASGTNNFVAGTISPSPAGGVTWTQKWTTGTVGKVYSNSSLGSANGGTATIKVYFKDNNNNADTSWFATQDISWNNVSNQLYAPYYSLNGTFLDSFASCQYMTYCNNLSSQNNRTHYLTGVGGTLQNSGAGIGDAGLYTFTFNTGINKNTANQTRTVSLVTVFNRPQNIVSSNSGSYTAPKIGPTQVNATFSYPSFWLLTNGGITPTNSDIINGTSFYSSNGVTQLSETNTFGSQVDNNNGVEKTFWFGVRTTNTQPTTFQKGKDSSYTPDTAYFTASVNLQPTTSLPPLYTAEPYTLYGITLPANTLNYIKIS